MDKNLSAIVVIANDRAIGKNGELLCHLPADLKHFKAITMGHTIIMGRKTFESLPKGALAGRQNIVVTRNASYSHEGITVASSIDDALKKVEMPGECFIIGGAQLYTTTINDISRLYLTQLHAYFPEADTFFPEINTDEWQEVSREDHDADEKNHYSYSFITLQRRP
jgi:dihydrofolate reductase